MNILIIGYGIVGHNMNKIFTDADIHDPYLNFRYRDNTQYDIAFVCVPTPMNEDGSCNWSIVDKVCREHKEHVNIFCIRSTIPPGTTDHLNLYNIPCIFSPEYYGETIHANGHDYDFIILGGDKLYTAIVAEAYKEVKHSNLKIFQTDSTTAELCKYMENCWLAMKVTFCNEFYRIADKAGIDFNELRELWLADPRINRSHTWVFKNQPYYDSKCLNKDIPALIKFAESIGYDTDLMEAVEEINRHFKEIFNEN